MAGLNEGDIIGYTTIRSIPLSEMHETKTRKTRIDGVDSLERESKPGLNYLPEDGTIYVNSSLDEIEVNSEFCIAWTR